MSDGPSPPNPPNPPCLLVAGLPGCTWSAHNYKHRSFDGATAAHTRRPNPALYLPGIKTPDMERLERETVAGPGYTAGTRAGGGKTEYLREMDESIGWDDGQDAYLSYVECSGGVDSARTFHGRPMQPRNRTARRMVNGDDQ